ncbi:uncharacterized protein EKO05_0000922 [Ascochyta rabiei]|nr:uncharacterized protein EKO05_0000922 [Ascochyta rabiei]UPX10255.1 hypothetical protein EKO05_0000922 [Ascochyta rabiei]
MPPEWVAFHARRTNTKSSTLRPAAFPSLPLGQPPSEIPPVEVLEIDPELIEESHRSGLEDIHTSISSPAHTDSPDTPRRVTSPHGETYSQEEGGAVQEAYDSAASASTLTASAAPPAQKRKPPRPSSSSSTTTTSVLAAKVAKLTLKKHALESQLRQLHNKLNLTPDPPRGPFLPSPPSSTEQPPPDPKVLKRKVEDLSSEIWRTRHQTRHVVKARRQFFAADPVAVESPAPSIPSAFKESRSEQDQMAVLTCAPPRPERVVVEIEEVDDGDGDGDGDEGLLTWAPPDAGVSEGADYFGFSADAPYFDMWWRMEMGDEPLPSPLDPLPLPLD